MNPNLNYIYIYVYTLYMDVSENSGTPKSSILIGFSIINHLFWGTPIFGNTHIYIYMHPGPIQKLTCPHQKGTFEKSSTQKYWEGIC